MNIIHSSAKVALLKQIQPYFPNDPKLPSLPECWDDLAAITRCEREQYVAYMLPYWQGLAGAYQQALATPFGNDSATLVTQVEDWPESFSAQQKGLYELLQTSKLRMAWRSYCEWTAVQRAYFTDGQRKVLAELEREHAEGSCPLAEIPLYQGWMRTSCQQLICIPVSVWRSMYSSESRYEPAQIDRATVERLATRVARVFNTPPLGPMEFLKESPGWSEAVVWSTSQRGLTSTIDIHGMTDREKDEDGWSKNVSDQMMFPEWRYKGFGGQIRVTLENGTPWFVTVLAPTHFVRRLMIYAQWFERVSAAEAPLNHI